MNDLLTRQTNIKATVICDSINNQGVRITTMELEYPRFIHAEARTHRMLKFMDSMVCIEQDCSVMGYDMFSRNSSSSRAVPTLKAIEQVESNMAVPLYWGANKGGMQAGGEVENIAACKMIWNDAFDESGLAATALHGYNLHKQHAARLIEPFQMIKVLVTATEWDNFYNLRLHPDAQPEIIRLAYEMYKAQQESTPILLGAGEWHLPYIYRYKSELVGDFMHYYLDDEEISLDQAIRISASCCAQTSYRKTDTSLEKADSIFDMLIKADVLHSSPFEHLATPVNGELANQIGITHYSAKGPAVAWSGNLREWIQYRHTLPSNTCNNFNFDERMELFK